MWKSPRIETYQEGEADKARQVELDSTEEIRCNANQQDIFRESDATMITTSSKAHSMLETWYCAVLRTKQGYINSIPDGKVLSLLPKSLDQAPTD